MKFITIATALFAMFAVSAFARPNDHDDDYDEHHGGDHGGYHHGYDHGYGRGHSRNGGDDDLKIHGCEGQGDLTGLLPGVLQAGILSNNKKYCIQTIEDTDH